MDMNSLTESIVLLMAMAVPAFLLARRGNAIVRQRFALGYLAMVAAAVFTETSAWWLNWQAPGRAFYVWLAVFGACMAVSLAFFIAGVYALHKGARVAPA